MKFEFATAGKILFGPGKALGVADAARPYGQRCLLVRGKDAVHSEPVRASLASSRLEILDFIVPGEPTTDLVTEGARIAREQGCDVVVGVGGGSAIDAAKAISALVTNPGEVTEYLEVIGQGRPLLERPAPCLAVPTTAGTGAEVTRNAVLASPENKVKVSLRHPLMLPDVAIVDPLLTHTMSRAVTAATGLDALTQNIEPYVSRLSNPLTDAVCREGMMRAGRSLRKAYESPEDAAAREDMALASLCGGLALANAKLGAVHGFAGPLGGMFDAPHGAVCGRLLPFVFRVNLKAVRRLSVQQYIERFDEASRILTGRPGATADEGVEWLHELVTGLEVPALSEYGVRESHFPEIVAKAQKASSMKGNPVQLSDAELTEILVLATG